jgi:hypothetical protein
VSASPEPDVAVFRAASTTGGGRTTELAPADLVASRARLLGASVVIGAGMLAYFLTFQLVWQEWATAPGAIVGGSCSLAFALIALYVWRAPPTRRRLVVAGTTFQVLFGLGLAIMEPYDLGEGIRPYTLISWNCVNILLVPVLVPAALRFQVGLAFLLAAFSHAGFVLLAGQPGVPDFALDATLSLVLPPYLCALVVTVPAKMVGELRRDLSKARRLGAYELVERLGQGGMGEVWRGQHRLLKRPAAVKLVRPELLGESEDARRRALTRFEREAQAIATLESPHTVRLFDFGVAEDGSFFAVMELLRGLDVQRLVDAHGPMPPERAVHLLRQACDSLAEAHGRGLVHRDIKPGNLFVGPRGRAHDVLRVLDFGLVKDQQLDRDADVGLTHDGQIQGTPSTLAPEAALGAATVDGRADLYALGCVAYFMVTGETVFDARNAMAMVVAQVSHAPQAPSERTEQAIPEGFDEVVLALLAKDPADRPPTAEAVAERLDAIEGLPAWGPERRSAWWRSHEPATLEAI